MTPLDAPGQGDIRAFYDRFLRSRMLQYRLARNLRLQRALAFVQPHVAPDTLCLDIGCGIGIVTEAIARRASRGFVWACDLSADIVWYARQTVRDENVEFFVGDVLRDFDGLRARVSRPVSLVVMVDVLEHLPLPSHVTLFANLRSIVTEHAEIVLTHPSPAYQAHLRAHNPAELQIIDETVEPEHLLEASAAAGFYLKYYSLEDVRLPEQYVHCVLRVRHHTTRLTPLPPGSLAHRLKDRIRGVCDRLLRPVRRRRYVTRVFRDT